MTLLILKTHNDFQFFLEITSIVMTNCLLYFVWRFQITMNPKITSVIFKITSGVQYELQKHYFNDFHKL